jgi:hypothetical protein
MQHKTCQSASATGKTTNLDGTATGWRQTKTFKSFVAVSVAMIVMAFLLLTTACTATPTAIVSAPPSALIAIAVLLDKTGSAPKFGVPQPEMDTFELLIGVISSRGGDLRVGPINDHQPDAMIRLRVSPPPANQPVPPKETTGNSFIDQEKMENYLAQKSEFDSAYQRWHEGVERDAARFQQQLKVLLLEPPTAPRTDILDAIRRADLFLSEPQPLGQQPVHRYLICSTDGLNNVHASPLTMSSGARLIIVNASGSVGSLESLRPLQFESLDAAIDFVQKTEVSKKEDK